MQLSESELKHCVCACLIPVFDCVRWVRRVLRRRRPRWSRCLGSRCWGLTCFIGSRLFRASGWVSKPVCVLLLSALASPSVGISASEAASHHVSSVAATPSDLPDCPHSVLSAPALPVSSPGRPSPRSAAEVLQRRTVASGPGRAPCDPRLRRREGARGGRLDLDLPRHERRPDGGLLRPRGPGREAGLRARVQLAPPRRRPDRRPRRDAPAEKLERMRARHGARATGAGGGRFERLNAAADGPAPPRPPRRPRAGRGGGGCARRWTGSGAWTAQVDGDGALLFGATRVYKKLNLSADFPTQSRLEATDVIRAADAPARPEPHRPDLDARRPGDRPALVAPRARGRRLRRRRRESRGGDTRRPRRPAPLRRRRRRRRRLLRRLPRVLPRTPSTRSSRARSTPPSRPCPRARGARRANTTAGASPGRSGAAAGAAPSAAPSPRGGCVPSTRRGVRVPVPPTCADERWMEKVKRRARETGRACGTGSSAPPRRPRRRPRARSSGSRSGPDASRDHPPDPRGPGPAPCSRGRPSAPGGKVRVAPRPDAAKFPAACSATCATSRRAARARSSCPAPALGPPASAEVPRDASEGERFRGSGARGGIRRCRRARKPQRNRGFAP